jgi:hypothetical protein
MSVAFPLGRLEDHDVEHSAAPTVIQINHAFGRHAEDGVYSPPHDQTLRKFGTTAIRC